MIPQNASISGGVRDNVTNNAISGATVRLEQSGQIKYTTTSNSSGNYSFSNVTPGNYNLVGLKSGYQNWSQSKTLSPGDNLTGQDIAMVPLNASVGTITVTTNLDVAAFDITGPANYSGSGKNWSQSGAPPGTYTITFSGPSNYNVTPQTETKTLSGSSSISFTATYTIKQINPQVTVNPTSGVRGTTEFVQSGSGFMFGGTAELHFKYPDNSQQSVNKPLANNGTFSNTWLAPNDAQIGTYQFWAKDLGSGKSSNVVNYSVSGSGNSQPLITNANYQPSNIYKNITPIAFSVSYQDQDNDKPSVKKLELLYPNSSSWKYVGDMQPLTENYEAGTIFKYELLPLTEVGSYKTRAVFNDGSLQEDIISVFPDFEVKEYNPDKDRVPIIVSSIPNQSSEVTELEPIIQIIFDTPMKHESFQNNIDMQGSNSGYHAVSYTLESEMKTLSIETTLEFLPGEDVTIKITKEVTSLFGTEMEQDYTLQFKIKQVLQNSFVSIGVVKIYADGFEQLSGSAIKATSNIRINENLFVHDNSNIAEVIIDKSNNTITGKGKLIFSSNAGQQELWSGNFEINPNSGLVVPKGIAQPLLQFIDGFLIDRDDMKVEIDLINKIVTIDTYFILSFKGIRNTIKAKITINSNGNITAKIQQFVIKIAGVNLAFYDAYLQDGAILAKTIQFEFPSFLQIARTDLHLRDVVIKPNELIINKADIGVLINTNNFSIDAKLNFDTNNYVFGGSGELKIKGLLEERGIYASFEIRDKGLNQIGFEVSGINIPIGHSGFFLKAIYAEGNGIQEDTHEISFKADFIGGIKLGNGYIINAYDGNARNNGFGDNLGASLTIQWGADSGFHLTGSLKVIEFIKAYEEVEYSINTRVFESNLKIEFDLANVAGVKGSAVLKIWKVASNLFVSGEAGLKGYIKKGAVFGFWPKSDKDIVEGRAQFGPYNGEYGNIIFGLWATFKVNAWVFKKYSIFVNQYGTTWNNSKADEKATAFRKPPGSTPLTTPKTKMQVFASGIEKIRGFKSYISSIQTLNIIADTLYFEFNENAAYGAFTMRWQSGIPQLELINPDNIHFTPNNIPADSSIFYDEYVGASGYFTQTPASGLWKIIIKNVDQNTEYDVSVYGGFPKAQILSVSPSSPIKLESKEYEIKVNVSNPDSINTVNLYFDTDGEGYDGQFIGSYKPSFDESFIWNTENVEAGSYYIYAILYTGSHSDFTYSQGTIDIEDKIAPLPPRFFKSIPRTNGMMIHFMPSLSPDVYGYMIIMKNLATNKVDTLDIVDQNMYSIYSPKDTSEVSAVSYDNTGNLSSPTNSLIAFAAAPGDTIPPSTTVLDNVEIVNSTSVKLGWMHSDDDVMGYILRMGTSSLQYSYSLDLGLVNNYTVNELLKGSTYYFVLLAYDQYLNVSNHSSEKSIKIVSKSDADMDGLLDDWEEFYWGSIDKVNEPNADYDNDLVTNAEEMRMSTNPLRSDTDLDKVPDGVDLHPTLNIDLDDDQMPDDWELFHNITNATLDSDNDGLSNILEYSYGCNPNIWDTDYDGVSDGEEVKNGTNPRDPRLNSPPVISAIPDTSFMVGDTLKLILSEYVKDMNDDVSTISWSVEGNNNITVLIANDEKTVKFTSVEYIGSEGMIFIATDPGGMSDSTFATITVISAITHVSNKTNNLPRTFMLFQNYPNPFNPETKIQYQLPVDSEVIIRIYNILGKEVLKVLDEKKQAGIYQITWDGRDKNGIMVSSGIYLVRVQAGDFVDTKKMLLIR